MFVRIDPLEPEPWLLSRVIDVLRKGGVAVLPTDTLYGIACLMSNAEAAKRLYALKGLDPRKPLAILLPDVGAIAPWARSLDTPAFRLLKRVLPGPYTFILQASAEVPRQVLRGRKTIGVRVPDQPLVLAILEELGEPLLTTSVTDDEGGFVNDPLAIEERLGGVVDVVVDAGPCSTDPSTIVDLTSGSPEILRVGKGSVEALGIVED